LLVTSGSYRIDRLSVFAWVPADRVALNPIRKKIEALKYDAMEDFELDLKQLIDNARLYNSPDSLVFASAEQMQKVVFEKMGKQYFGQEPAGEDFLWMQFKVCSVHSPSSIASCSLPFICRLIFGSKMLIRWAFSST
jgi:hypothetical protein